MSQEYVHFCLQPYALFLLAVTLHLLFPTLAEYQP
jgi:hypothetical protein